MLPAYASETQHSSGAAYAKISAPQTGTISINSKNRPLRDVLQEIRARCSAEVKLPQNLAGDIVLRSIQDSTWQAVVGHLLEDYNYSAVWGQGGRPAQLTVYGRNKNADESSVTVANTTGGAGDDLLVYETVANLPQKFHGMNPGSVIPVSIPAERMKNMAIGEKVSLALPCGQFTVVYDKQFQHGNGDSTWVGHIENSGEGYRVIITMGNEGSRGQVTTPDGTYSLYLEEGRTWLVDANASTNMAS